MVNRFKGSFGLIGKLFLGVAAVTSLASSPLLSRRAEAGVVKFSNYTPPGSIGMNYFYTKNISGASEGLDPYPIDSQYMPAQQTNALAIYSVISGINPSGNPVDAASTDSQHVDTSGWNFYLGVKGNVTNIPNSILYNVTNTTNLTGKTLRLSDSNGLFTPINLIMDGVNHFITLPNLTSSTGVYDTLRLDILNPTDLYWDKNGTSSGAGGTTPNGNWTDSSSWNAVADGTGTPLNWMTSNAVFSAGNDATGNYTVNVNGTQQIKGITFKDGSTTLTGGALELIASTPIEANCPDYINSNITGSGGLVKSGTGTLYLGGVNDYSGGTFVNEGTLFITNADSLPSNGSLSIGSGGNVILNSGLGQAISLGGLNITNSYSASCMSPVTPYASSSFENNASSVPEPGALELLLAGVAGTAGLIGARRVKQYLRRKEEL